MAIYNEEVYLERMLKTIPDKAWWVEYIPSEIDTVVDFGCAAGDLGIYLEYMYPHRFRYIGIDNNVDMLAKAKEQHLEVYPSFEDIEGLVDSFHCVLVLNSVMHEVFTYLTGVEQIILFAKMRGFNFKYIAIRDMFLYSLSLEDLPTGKIYDAIINSKYKDTYRDYVIFSSCGYKNYAPGLVDFLLKYTYKENWNRERDEQYLWNWMPTISKNFSNYKIMYNSQFFIPYIREQIKKDFGIDLSICTHKKLLLELPS